ncbi:hypothetical protein RIF29_16978 [Crotalaria pallida]|uniref:GATA transcription factor 25 n=1 Tax=Crotalaria pallida TaxID=3830 RepID=A0AAN9FG65_CROPI
MEPPMYDHTPPMNNMPNQICAAENDDGSADVSIDPIPYDTHGLEHGNGGGGAEDGVYVPGEGGVDAEFSIQPCDDPNQLTLTFRGQVYVFDSVTPDKVQAVFLLLGGCESPCPDTASQHNQRGSLEFPSRCSQPQRAASLIRFRQKRKERCFDKKVRYGVRQEVALRMHRNKGQFTSAKKQDSANSGGKDQDSGQDDSQSETACTHCGISSKSTPMMRRGPNGPRSLCNACGLFWANRGTLRDLSKRNQEHSCVPAEQVNGGNDSDGGTAIPAHNGNLVAFSDNDNPDLVSDH